MRYHAYLLPFGAALFIATALAWLNGGLQVYFKTKYQVVQTDAITGLEYSEWHDSFLPGAETLMLGAAAMAICAVAASILRRRSSPS